MALSNLDRVNKGMDLLHAGLHPYVIEQLKSLLGEEWQRYAVEAFPPGHHSRSLAPGEWDIQALLHQINKHWKGGFDNTLGHAERAQVSELMEFRKRTAHQNKTNAFDTNDAGRVLDNVSRLLRAIGASQAEDAEVQRDELFRIRYDESNRKRAKNIQTQSMDTTHSSGLPAWRQIIEPHEDVANGRYQIAEFAADLWTVYRGNASDEYGKPVDFFNRTHLTGGIRKLLLNALLRLNGKGGDPIINLQTNFGGGKTHSLIALYHLVSGSDFSSVRDLESFFQNDASGQYPPANVARAVIVGEKIQINRADKKPDGTTVNTIWGEIAWQLGGAAGYDIVREADEAGLNPGEALETLFRSVGPSLVLIDEWVTYIRQLTDSEGQRSGSYGTHMSFVQALCGAAKASKDTLLVVSIPSSDYEMGGEQGQRAAGELKHLFARTESPWGIATTEESFEIVTRRLFAPITTREAMEQRDIVARAMGDFYRANRKDFPNDANGAEYEKRIKECYPIHPELFDALANSWASLERFQKTRGILRLMAKIIQNLWESGDSSPLIIPAMLPLDIAAVQEELMNYLAEPWRAVIHKDVDGQNSLPRQIDSETLRFNQIARGATRRVARTLFFSTAPTKDAAQKGMDEQRLKLGSILPGENIPVFTDALRQLLNRGTYVYHETNRYWYDTQNNVNRTAEERAAHIGVEEAAACVLDEVRKWTEAKRNTIRLHLMPASSADVPDDNELKLVLLSHKDTHTNKDEASDAYQRARDILAKKGNGPRMYRNTLIFVAPDKAKMAELIDVARRYLAWRGIDRDANRNAIELSNHQMVQVTDNMNGTLNTLKSRMPEVFIWMLAPYQENGGTADIAWEELRLNGPVQDGIIDRAVKKLVTQGILYDVLGSSVLRQHIDKNKLWRDRNYVGVRELRDDFTKYLYMAKIKNHSVLLDSIEDGLNLLAWNDTTFAYADSWNEETQRYVGLRAGQLKKVSLDSDGLLVRPSTAQVQLDKEEEERAAAKAQATGSSTSTAVGGSSAGNSTSSYMTGGGTSAGSDHKGNTQEEDKPQVKKWFHGHVEINAQRFFRDAENIEKEILKHLLAADGAGVRVTLHIEADSPEGFTNDTIRVIKENGRTLKFDNTEFE